MCRVLQWPTHSVLAQGKLDQVVWSFFYLVRNIRDVTRLTGVADYFWGLVYATYRAHRINDAEMRYSQGKQTIFDEGHKDSAQATSSKVLKTDKSQRHK
jgi:hypothetical protein